MDNKYPVYSEKTQCQDCYKCVRHCPVKAIYIRDGSAGVMADRCILCGQCVMVCPFKAKRIRTDTALAENLIRTKKKVFVSLAPSFVSHYGHCNTDRLLTALHTLGFAGVSETALGAQQVSEQVARYISQSAQTLYLSSACPVAADYVQKYYPKLAAMVTPFHSPLCAHATQLKDLYGQDAGVVFIGPCIAKKSEADQFGDLIDAALTFEELDEWFKLRGIVLDSELPSVTAFIPRRAGLSEIYPIEGGMCKTIEAGRTVPCRLISISGMEAIDLALKNIESIDGSNGKVFVELLACKGGCINGPGTRKSGTILGQQEVYAYSS